MQNVFFEIFRAVTQFDPTLARDFRIPPRPSADPIVIPKRFLMLVRFRNLAAPVAKDSCSPGESQDIVGSCRAYLTDGGICGIVRLSRSKLGGERGRCP